MGHLNVIALVLYFRQIQNKNTVAISFEHSIAKKFKHYKFYTSFTKMLSRK